MAVSGPILPAPTAVYVKWIRIAEATPGKTMFFAGTSDAAGSGTVYYGYIVLAAGTIAKAKEVLQSYYDGTSASVTFDVGQSKYDSYDDFSYNVNPKPPLTPVLTVTVDGTAHYYAT